MDAYRKIVTIEMAKIVVAILNEYEGYSKEYVAQLIAERMLEESEKYLSEEWRD